MKLKINKKFETLCPALSSDEFQRLEQNCLEDGRVLDAILIWKDQIIDGHNRYKIATKHGLKFDTVCRTFKDDKEAENWIINHQLGRRNLNPQAQSYLRGKLHQARKLNKSENSKKTKPQNEVSFFHHLSKGADTMDETGPAHSQGYGHAEHADDSRQAQHSQSNDTPTDVNMNAVVAREQAGTLTLMGKNFEAGASRRNALFDHIAAVLGGKQGGA